MARSIDLDDFHDAVKLAISGSFPTVPSIEDYDADRKDLVVPAILIELVDMEADPESDPGTEQLPVVSKWVARIIMSFRTENVKREIRKLSGSLGVMVHQNRWGMPASPAQVTYIGPDAFDPEFDKFEVWAVEWDQQLDLGQSVWTGKGITPERVMIGYAPEIGPGQEGDYDELGGSQ
ncbi:hypothetical protein MACH18_12700 [Phaeobacter italicus]|uniref:hypothetical protein n=1 Tax=Phaeobacter italicus TaxID=481446 RepID=UPI00275CD167|nr:hypothetical protein [Phaeobacter italicus]GLO74190.1 hypothetical protein MACH18_12700 [Phaeobacter italicus]